MGRSSDMIITTAQVKAILQISGTSYDNLIGLLIPEAEAKYLQIRGIPFTQIKADITTGDKTVSNIALYPTVSTVFTDFQIVNPSRYLERMEYLYNATNDIDDYITEIDIDNNTVELSGESLNTATSVLFTVYPQGAKMATAKIIGYFLNKQSMNGMQSESIGTYSYTRGSDMNNFGIPMDIVQSIKRYINA